jgi:hypothetical protein
LWNFGPKSTTVAQRNLGGSLLMGVELLVTSACLPLWEFVCSLL